MKNKILSLSFTVLTGFISFNLQKAYAGTQNEVPVFTTQCKITCEDIVTREVSDYETAYAGTQLTHKTVQMTEKSLLDIQLGLQQSCRSGVVKSYQCNLPQINSTTEKYNGTCLVSCVDENFEYQDQNLTPVYFDKVTNKTVHFINKRFHDIKAGLAKVCSAQQKRSNTQCAFNSSKQQ